ncbi:sigma-70 family RNA polymerase sigma factor [Novosphingobium resinovorum]|uniref:sigma-70 family RNA polymerase sigma factor n=1 Tax=Novosphingobium resinovorum TaxID=158500 RepID=UPI002ED1A6E2|nr:sigma-70 family RNA polymerase sigma factor [Novosphingobium resinovorum]
MKGETRRLEIWRAHRARLIDSVVPLVGDRGTAEDVVQDAWLRFNRMEDVDDRPIQRQPVGYLYRIVRNLAIDLMRRRTIERSISPADSPIVEHVADPRPSPEREAIDRSELDRVKEQLATLPKRTRIAFEMYNFGGYTLQHIADHLSISVGMTHLLIKQAVACCMEAIADGDD